jgi:hypothetical protein
MNKHTLLPALVAVLALIFLNPGMLFGNHSMSTVLLFGTLFLLTTTYGYYVVVDRADDEREVMIRSFADRLASLVGMAGLLLIIGICLLTSHPVPNEIILVLVSMIAAKALGQWYACKYF